MSNPYQAPLETEQSLNQPNTSDTYSTIEISELYRCRQATTFLLAGLYLNLVLFIAGIFMSASVGNIQELGGFRFILFGLGAVGGISSFIGTIMLMKSPLRSGAKELFMFSFALGIISGVGPSILSVMDVPITTSIITTLILAALPLFCLILFLTAWRRLGLFIKSYDVSKRMRRARTAFCCTLLLFFLGFILMATLDRYSGWPTGLSVLLVGSIFLSGAISLIVFVINYGNGLTSFRRDVYMIMLSN
ncbi:MAG: hypothetical protein CMJ76_12965 [Planctomycetaceae bacterium]|nr:hypothetical protein [Planctomycetaceae bacterium]